jgi:hypothetical protein
MWCRSGCPAFSIMPFDHGHVSKLLFFFIEDVHKVRLFPCLLCGTYSCCFIVSSWHFLWDYIPRRQLDETAP